MRAGIRWLRLGRVRMGVRQQSAGGKARWCRRAEIGKEALGLLGRAVFSVDRYGVVDDLVEQCLARCNLRIAALGARYERDRQDLNGIGVLVAALLMVVVALGFERAQ